MEKINNIICNIGTALIYGALLGLCHEMFLRNKYLNAKKKRAALRIRKKFNLRLIKHNHNRECILKIGRDALRCKLTNNLMLNPVVGVIGYSFEKDKIQEINYYENRVLKEILEKIKLEEFNE
jgi:hypothetical protein